MKVWKMIGWGLETTAQTHGYFCVAFSQLFSLAQAIMWNKPCFIGVCGSLTRVEQRFMISNQVHAVMVLVYANGDQFFHQTAVHVVVKGLRDMMKMLHCCSGNFNSEIPLHDCGMTSTRRILKLKFILYRLRLRNFHIILRAEDDPKKVFSMVISHNNYLPTQFVWIEMRAF